MDVVIKTTQQNQQRFSLGEGIVDGAWCLSETKEAYTKKEKITYFNASGL